MRHSVSIVLFLSLCLPVVSDQVSASEFSQPDPETFPQLFQWTDTCNVFVLREGDAALLINLGNGRVLSRLADIGVALVDPRVRLE